MSNTENILFENKRNNKLASDLAAEIFKGTLVESAYDKKGKFSYLLARLPQSEFIRLYSINTSVSIFIQGFWLQMNLHSLKKTVLNRESKIELNLEFAINEYGICEVSFFRARKCVGRYKFKNMTAFDLFTTENGFHLIARAAAKTFYKIHHKTYVSNFFYSHIPAVMILPFQDRDKNLDFDASYVLLQ
jgi:hypothetical protein